jgi:UDP-GlcNAc:undecaprenyl-phosphate GlcNAc-1-phosphate transferase
MEFLVALIVTLVAAPIVRRFALRLGIVDRPGPLKTHRAPVPYLGGIAVFVGLLVGPLEADRVALLVPYALALALGVVDDARTLTPRTRLGAELVIAVTAAAVVPGPALVKFGSGVVVLMLLNAVNLLDGQDGLAAGACVVSAAAFAILGGDATTVGLALMGSLAAFLVFNAPPARMYLGDGGAYLVGTVLGTLPALTQHGSTEWSLWIATPLIVALPLADTAIAILRRLFARQPLLQGDRSHVYDQLVDRGWRVETSTAVCVLIQGALAALGVLAAGLDPSWALAVTGISTLAVIALTAANGFFGYGRAPA